MLKTVVLFLNKEYTPRTLISIWFVSAFLLFSVSLASQHIIQTGISHEEHARYVSVLLGRQQKRSQRLVEDAFEVMLYPNQMTVQDMKSIEPDWERAQRDSYDGVDLGWNIQQGDIPPQITNEAYQSNLDYLIMRGAIVNIIAGDTEKNLSADIHTLSLHEKPYLATYAHVFADLTTIADQEMNRIGTIELFILFPSTPILLFLTYFFTVRPSLRRLRHP